MRGHLLLVVVVLITGSVTPVGAGVYNRAEPPVELNQNLYQFVENDLPGLRSFGPPDGLTIQQESPARKDYLDKVKRLRAKGRLSAEDQANLGAYLIRLRKTRAGIPDYHEAVEVLEPAQREHPRDFYIVANLGTVHQLLGNLDVASQYLEQAKELCPTPELRQYEQCHWRLVHARARERPNRGQAPLDTLFPVRFIGESGQWEVGSLAEAERKKLPPDALKIVQQLLAWLPDDARLLWLLGELANAQGDIQAAHKALDTAVWNFGLTSDEIKQRRAALKDNLPKNPTFEIPEEESWFKLGLRHWIIVACGILLVVGLLTLQVREIWRRRSTAVP